MPIRPSTMPVIQRSWTDLSQGTLTPTGNALDVALAAGASSASQARTARLYTRNGRFHLSADGTLVSAEGYPVRAASGGSITAQGTLPLDIAGDGTVQQNGQVLGQLDVADFSDRRRAGKTGPNYFRAADPNRQPAAATGTTVEQGKLEASNTGTAESAVRLVGIMRQFEMLQKAVSIGNDMSKQAIEQVAKIGS